MTLRWRTLIIMVITLFSLILAVYTSAERILLTSFANLETQQLQEDVNRTVSALNQVIFNLDTLNHEWGAWDDTYHFIEDLNRDYITDNLHDQFFEDIDVNLVAYIDLNKKIVFSKMFDMESEKEVMLPPDLPRHLLHYRLLDHVTNIDSSTTGFITLHEGVMMISSRPILTSQYLGPSRGSIIMGRYLDDNMVTELAQTVHLSVEITAFYDSRSSVPGYIKSALLSSDFTTRLLTSDTIAGYTLIRDIYGVPSLIVRVDTPRAIYAQGQSSLSYFLTWLLISGLVFLIVVLVSLERSILARMLNLSAAVARYENLPISIPVDGNDELTSLARNIRAMLHTIHQYHNQLQNTNVDLEKRVQIRTQQLEDALKVKTQILANVSHDARTPLNVITLNIQLLQRYSDLSEKAKTRLNNILVSTNQLLGFFNNLLEESRTALGTTKLENNPFTPHELLHNVIIPLRILAQQKGLSLRTQIEPDVPSTLHGDVKRIEQILSNLVNNAIKFTADGTIEVRVFQLEAGLWGFSVSDTGRGISPQDQENVFEEFWQVDGSMTRDVNRGVGLGLSIVKQLVRLMGGTITVHSAIGIGSTFTVQLPIKEIINGESIIN